MQFESILNFLSEPWQGTKIVLEVEVQNYFSLNQKYKVASNAVISREVISMVRRDDETTSEELVPF